MTTGRYVALDFETSGYAAHSACAVGLCRIEDGVVTDSFYSLIRPPSSRVLFTHVHGLTWPMLKDAPTFTELWPQPFQANYRACDGTVVVRLKTDEAGNIQMAANIIDK